MSAGEALSGVPVNAVIVAPAADQLVRAGRVGVRGWAMGADGRQLASVEVSPNGGGEWVGAGITVKSEPWTWGLWEATLELGPGRHVSWPAPPTAPAPLSRRGPGDLEWLRLLQQRVAPSTGPRRVSVRESSS